MSDRTLREALRRSDLLMLRAIGENPEAADAMIELGSNRRSRSVSREEI